nr:hypothetical protein [Oceanococcus sp. HetDA_MAG_MS8]
MKMKSKGFGLAATALSAALAAGSAQAVNISTDGVGEVAIAPYYTVKNGWLTTINLTNTTNEAIAVKVRFREAQNSRDSLDFIVGLSAFDVFTAVVQERASDNKAVLLVRDQENGDGEATCTVPASVATSTTGTTLLAEAYGGNTNGAFSEEVRGIEEDGGPISLDRLKEGYIEFFVLGADDIEDLPSDYDDLSTADKQAPWAIEEHDCDYLNAAFGRRNVGPNNNGYGPVWGGTGNPGFYGTAAEFGEPTNALKFNVRLLNPGRGVEAGYEATTLANFYNPGAAALDGAVNAADNATCTVNIGDQREASVGEGLADWQPNGGNNSCQNFIAEQVTYAFLEPSLNNAFPEVANFWDDISNQAASLAPANGTVAGANVPNNVRGVDAVTALLTRRNVFNEWASDGVPPVAEITDWIVTFPVKNFYVDSTGPNGYGSQQAIGPGIFDRDENGELVDGTVPAPFAFDLDGTTGAEFNTSRPESILAGTTGTLRGFETFVVEDYFGINGNDQTQYRLADAYAPFEETFDGASCLEIGVALYDRAEEENVVVFNDDVTVSPSPPTSRQRFDLCNEVNIITFNSKSVLRSAANDPNFFGQGEHDVDTVNVGNSDFNTTAGWMSLDLNESGNADLDVVFATPAQPVVGGDTPDAEVEGAPVLGFVFKQRTFGPDAAEANYASAINHSYLRRILDGAGNVVTGGFTTP